MPNIVDALPRRSKSKGRLAYSAAWGLTCSAMPVSGSQANSLVAPLADASRAFAQSLSNATTGTASTISALAGSPPAEAGSSMQAMTGPQTPSMSVSLSSQPTTISSSASALISRLRLSWQSPPDFSLLITQLVQEQPLWLLGVAFMVLGTLSSACGMLLLKRATLGPAPVPPWYKNVWFWAGMSLIVVNASLLDIVAFGVTPLSLIAPFAGLTIVFSVVLVGIGCFGVREKPSTFSVISVGLIVLGVTMAATFGPHEDRALRPADMQVILDGHPGIAALGFAGAPLVLFVALAQRQWEVQSKAVLQSPIGSLTAALTGALFGGLTQLLFKTCATAVLQFFQTGGNPWDSIGSMCLQLCCAASCAVGQVVFLNVAIASSPVAYAVPAYQSALLLITLTLAGWLLEEFAHMEPLHYVLFAVGCGLVLLGIVFNAVALQASPKEKDDDADEKDDALDLPSARP